MSKSFHQAYPSHITAKIISHTILSIKAFAEKVGYKITPNSLHLGSAEVLKSFVKNSNQKLQQAEVKTV